MQSLLLDVDCWLEHITPSPLTGLDKPDVRVRAASGLGAADAFLGVFSLWRGLLRSLARLGYDESGVHLAAFDWRMRFSDLERRDRWFSRLKLATEELYRVNGGRKVVFLSHSMGANLFGYFLQWVHSAAPAVGEQCPYVAALEARDDADARWGRGSGRYSVKGDDEGDDGGDDGGGGGGGDWAGAGFDPCQSSGGNGDDENKWEGKQTGGHGSGLLGKERWECVEREAERAARRHREKEAAMSAHLRNIWLTAESGWEGSLASKAAAGVPSNQNASNAGLDAGSRADRTEQ